MQSCMLQSLAVLQRSMKDACKDLVLRCVLTLNILAQSYSAFCLPTAKSLQSVFLSVCVCYISKGDSLQSISHILQPACGQTYGRCTLKHWGMTGVGGWMRGHAGIQGQCLPCSLLSSGHLMQLLQSLQVSSAESVMKQEDGHERSHCRRGGRVGLLSCSAAGQTQLGRQPVLFIHSHLIKSHCLVSNVMPSPCYCSSCLSLQLSCVRQVRCARGLCWLPRRCTLTMTSAPSFTGRGRTCCLQSPPPR